MLSGCPMTTKTPAPVITRSPPPADMQIVPGAGVSERDYHVVQKGETLYSISLQYGQNYNDVARWNNLNDNAYIVIGQKLRIAPPESELAAAGPGVTVVPVIPPGSDVQPAGTTSVQSASTATNTPTYKQLPKAGKEPYSEQTAIAMASTPSAETKTAPAAGGDEPNWMWPAAGKVLGGFSEASKGIDIAGKAGDPVLASADGKVVYSGSGLRGYGKLVIIKHSSTYLSAYAHNQTILVKEGQSVTRGQRIAEMGNTDADQVKLHFEIRRQGNPVDPSRYLPPR